jgi:ADP-heptose:LPS heptosyltransferase
MDHSPSASFPSGLHEPVTRWTAFRLGHLGDIVLTTGVLAYLARTRGWSFSVVTRQAWADIFSCAPYVRSVIALEERELSAGSYPALCRKLAEEDEESGLLDLHDTLRSRMLSFFWRGPVLRYPKMSLRRRIFLASGGRAGGESLRATSVPQRYALAVESPSPPASALRPRIFLSAEEKAAASAILERLFGPNSRPVALHPYAAHPLKTWPARRWQEFASLLSVQGIPWIVLGKGVPLFPNRKEEMSNTATLRQSTALLSCCRALVTGDSGPLHLAAAVDTPVVALFGPTTREWGFYPSGPRDIVLENSLPCRPCSLHGKTLCPYAGKCLADISAERALKAVEYASASSCETPSTAGSLRACAWRGAPDAPDAEEILLEQLREEEIYRSILLAARQEESSLESLFFPAATLAYPKADEALVRQVAGRDADTMLRWRHELDEDGNPRWISLHLPERRDADGNLAPGSILPSGEEGAVPPEKGPTATNTSPEERKGFLSRMLRRFTPMREAETRLTINPYERFRASRAAAPPSSPLGRFLFRLLRITLFAVILFEIAQILLHWGLLPELP